LRGDANQDFKPSDHFRLLTKDLRRSSFQERPSERQKEAAEIHHAFAWTAWLKIPFAAHANLSLNIGKDAEHCELKSAKSFHV